MNRKKNSKQNERNNSTAHRVYGWKKWKTLRAKVGEQKRERESVCVYVCVTKKGERAQSSHFTNQPIITHRHIIVAKHCKQTQHSTTEKKRTEKWKSILISFHLNDYDVCGAARWMDGWIDRSSRLKIRRSGHNFLTLFYQHWIMRFHFTKIPIKFDGYRSASLLIFFIAHWIVYGSLHWGKQISRWQQQQKKESK